MPTTPLASRSLNLSDMLKQLGDPARHKIIAAIGDGEVSVTQICDATNMAQPNVSHHLASLRLVGLVSSRRVSACVYNSVNRDLLNATADAVRNLIPN